MINCQELTKIYRTARGEVRSLNEVHLEIKRGEFICVRGPSGCGKTTLLLALGAMLHPTHGNVSVAGKDIYALTARERARFRARNIGFVFQMFHLVPYLNVRDNVLLAGNGNAKQARVTELLDQLGLSPRQHHKPAQLSAGERQRTALARALLNRPELILADEPTGNLDPDNASEVFRQLKAYQESGGTVMVVTHGSSGEGFATRILEMRAGKLR